MLVSFPRHQHRSIFLAGCPGGRNDRDARQASGTGRTVSRMDAFRNNLSSRRVATARQPAPNVDHGQPFPTGLTDSEFGCAAIAPKTFQRHQRHSKPRRSQQHGAKAAYCGTLTCHRECRDTVSGGIEWRCRRAEAERGAKWPFCWQVRGLRCQWDRRERLWGWRAGASPFGVGWGGVELDRRLVVSGRRVRSPGGKCA